MSVLLVAACLGSGAAIGFLGGLLGIGGGLIAIPALVLLFSMSQQSVQGTALIMVLPAITLTVRKYNQRAYRSGRRRGGGGWFRGLYMVGCSFGLGHRFIDVKAELCRVFVLARRFYTWQGWKKASRIVIVPHPNRLQC